MAPKKDLKDDASSDHEGGRDELSILDQICISNSLGKDWKFLARAMGIEEAKLQSIEEENKTAGLSEMAYQVLIIWKDRMGKKATRTALQHYLKSIRRTCSLNTCMANSTDGFHNDSKCQNGKKDTLKSPDDDSTKPATERVKNPCLHLEMMIPENTKLSIVVCDRCVNLNLGKDEEKGAGIRKQPDNLENNLTALVQEFDRVIGEDRQGQGSTPWAKFICKPEFQESEMCRHLNIRRGSI